MRFVVDPATSEAPVFVGIGPTTKSMATYLDGVGHDVIRDFELSPDRVSYRRVPGDTTPAAPAEQQFWAAQLTTDQPDSLTWEVESGDWTVVVMNADASRGVDLDAGVGIKLDWLLPAIIGMLAAGLVLLAGGTLLVIFGSRGAAPAAEPLPLPPPPPGAAPQPSRRRPAAPRYRSSRTRYVSAGDSMPELSPLAVAGEVVPGHPALHRAGLPLDRVPPADDRRGFAILFTAATHAASSTSTSG